jgi:hypothetical protein
MRPLPSIERYRASDYYQRRKIKAQYLKRGLPPPNLRKDKPSPLKGKTRPNLQGPRGEQPHLWKTGPDPLTHDKFRGWHKHRSQALFRKEPYELSFEDFEHIWGVLWHQKGRGRDDYCLTRQDRQLPWTRTNTLVTTRRDHATRNLKGLPNGTRIDRRSHFG